MKKPWRIRLHVVAGLFVMMILFMAGECTIVVDADYIVSGSVVNARSNASSAGVGDVKIAIYDESNSEVALSPVTSSSDGTFTLPRLISGEYTLKPSKTGWFIPEQKITISGQNSSLAKPVPAFQLDPNDNGGISFILMWETAVHDVDLWVSYTVESNELTDADMPYGVSEVEKERVYFENRTSSAQYRDGSLDAVVMDRDVMNSGSTFTGIRTGYGPETTTLRFIPNIYATGPTVQNARQAGLDENGLYAAFGDTGPTSFDWVGHANVYFDLFTQNSGAKASLQAARPSLYIIQTIAAQGATKGSSGMTYNYLGKIDVEFDATTVSVARVNFLVSGNTEYFQILPNYRIETLGPGTNGANLRSVSDQNQIIGVTGRTR